MVGPRVPSKETGKRPGVYNQEMHCTNITSRTLGHGGIRHAGPDSHECDRKVLQKLVHLFLVTLSSSNNGTAE